MKADKLPDKMWFCDDRLCLATGDGQTEQYILEPHLMLNEISIEKTSVHS